MDFMGYDGMYGMSPEAPMQDQMYAQNQLLAQQNMMMQNQMMTQYQRKFSKAEIKQGLIDDIMSKGVNISKVDMIEEEPEQLRHACEPVGVSSLCCNTFPVIQPYGTTQVKYWCCTACGKLFISKFSLDSV